MTRVTMPAAAMIRYRTNAAAGMGPPWALFMITNVMMKATSQTSQAPMYHRVVIRLLMRASWSQGPYSLIQERDHARGYLMSAEKFSRGGRIRTLGPRFWRPML